MRGRRTGRTDRRGQHASRAPPDAPYASLKPPRTCAAGLRKALNPSGEFDSGVVVLSGALSGGLAAGLTTPLDVIKTKLQVQSLSAPASGVGAAPGEAYFVQYSGFWSAVRSIARESGFAGFWLGLGPRVAMYAPSCAVSWVAYEGLKALLARSASTRRVAVAKHEA